MKDAIGIVEVVGSANAVVVTDLMLKTADVRFLTWEHFNVGRGTVFIEGDVAAVSAAVERAAENLTCEVFASYVIPRPHEETSRLLERSVNKNKKIAVIGAGGVGGYLTGMLAKTFPHVSVVARGKRGESIRENGLVLHSGHKGEIVAHPEHVVNCVDELAEQDIIFICVKNYSLEEVCAQLKNVVTDQTIVVPIMNGIDPGNRTRQLLGKGKVIDALIYCVSFANEDFSITQQGDFADIRIGIVGEQNELSGTTEDVNLLSQLLTEADQDHKISKNIEVDIWKKYILNCSFSVSTAFYNETIGQLRSDEAKAKEYEALVRESCVVAKKKGVKIPEHHADVIIRQFYEELRDDATSSLQRDIWAGRDAEIDTFPGYLVKEAKKLGVEVPVSARMYEEMLKR